MWYVARPKLIERCSSVTLHRWGFILHNERLTNRGNSQCWQNSPKTKKGSSVFSRSSTTTTSPGKSFRTEKSSLGSEADGLCMMLRSFSLRNGSADTVTLFILHSVSWLWSSSPFRHRTSAARRSQVSPSCSGRSSGALGPMLTLAISVAAFPLSQAQLSVSARRRREQHSEWGGMWYTDGLSQCGKQTPPLPSHIWSITWFCWYNCVAVNAADPFTVTDQ